MDKFKNEYLSELLRAGLTPEQARKALYAFAVAMHGYTLSQKEANLVVYNGQELAQRMIQLYINVKRVENCSDGHCKNLQLILTRLFDYVGKGPKEMTSFDVLDFLSAWQAKRKTSGRTMDTYRQLINIFFNWLVDEGYMQHNPVKSIKRIRQEQKEREALTQMELETIRRAVKTAKERVLIEVLYSTGCRASEFAGIKLTDVNLAAGTVSLFGKGKKHRTGYLNARAILAIKSLLEERKYQSEYLYGSSRAPHGRVSYVSVERDLSKIAKRVEDQLQHKIHPHLIRHTTATIAMANGLPVQEIQMLLGHASINTTMIYAKTDKEDLRRDHMKYVV